MSSIDSLISDSKIAYLDTQAVIEAGVNDFTPLIDAIEQAYILHSKGETRLPKSDYLKYENRPSYDRIIPLLGYLGGDFNISGLKQICSGTQNYKQGFSRASGIIILNDPETNRPFGLLEASLISAARTASVSGVVLRRYVKPDMKTVSIIGCGQLARTHLKMITDVFGPDRFEFLAYDLASNLTDDFLSFGKSLGLRIEKTASAEDAVRMSEVIIPTTTSEVAYISSGWMKQDSIYCAVSLLDAELNVFEDAKRIIVDDLDQCLHEGRPLEVLESQGRLPREKIIAVGDALQTNAHDVYDEGRLVFNPMGTVLTDLAVSKVLFLNALKRGAFVELPV